MDEKKNEKSGYEIKRERIMREDSDDARRKHLGLPKDYKGPPPPPRSTW